MRIAPALIAVLVLAGCARVYPVPTDVAVPGMPNPEVALQQSMGNVAAEMEKLGHLGPAATAMAESVVPADLQLSCPRFFWTAICLTGGSDGEIEHEQNRTQVCG